MYATALHPSKLQSASRLQRSCVVLLSLGIATLACSVLWPHYALSPFAPYYIAVLIATSVAGPAFGVGTILASLWLVAYYFLLPEYSLDLEARSAFGCALFASLSSAIVWLVGRSQRRDLEAGNASERLHTVLESARLAYWMCDVESGASDNSLRHDQLFGYTERQTQWSYERFIGHVHVEDRGRVENVYAAALAAYGEYDVEYRVVLPDGTIHWRQSLGHVRVEAGRVRVYGVVLDIDERKGAEQRLSDLSQFDSLTGLPNRGLLLDRVQQSLALASRNGNCTAVLFVDLDRFKVVNDTLGHGVGDSLLRLVGLRLQGCVRASDSIGRLGGDEFALLLGDLPNARDAEAVGQKLLLALRDPFDVNGHTLYVSASIGISTFPHDGEGPEALLKNAETAMYRAKEAGGGASRFYLPEMNDRAVERLIIETELRGALARNEFVLHYQPKVSLANGEISGFEALLRWVHPERGLVPPLEFIGILEDTGLIVDVGRWVIRAACLQLAEWQRMGLKVHPVAVNVSVRQFKQADLDKMVASILKETGVPPELLELELTESLLMNDPDEVCRLLNSIVASGVRLSVDDFGTGYSSLAYLKSFPLDSLKIDRVFVRDVTVDEDDATIALAIINLAHSLHLRVVAEGVETAEHIEFLRSHGCDEIQGFYFAKPSESSVCTQMLLEGRKLGA